MAFLPQSWEHPTIPLESDAQQLWSKSAFVVKQTGTEIRELKEFSLKPRVSVLYSKGLHLIYDEF